MRKLCAGLATSMMLFATTASAGATNGHLLGKPLCITHQHHHVVRIQCSKLHPKFTGSRDIEPRWSSWR